MSFDSVPVRRAIIGAILRHQRGKAGYTLDDAARVLDCDRSKISRIETGQRGIRTLDLRELLAEYHTPPRRAGTADLHHRPSPAGLVAGLPGCHTGRSRRPGSTGATRLPDPHLRAAPGARTLPDPRVRARPRRSKPRPRITARTPASRRRHQRPAAHAHAAAATRHPRCPRRSRAPPDRGQSRHHPRATPPPFPVRTARSQRPAERHAPGTPVLSREPPDDRQRAADGADVRIHARPGRRPPRRDNRAHHTDPRQNTHHHPARVPNPAPPRTPAQASRQLIQQAAAGQAQGAT
jgi:transcriptional regulator with XRE-family HTH domain